VTKVILGVDYGPTTGGFGAFAWGVEDQNVGPDFTTLYGRGSMSFSNPQLRVPDNGATLTLLGGAFIGLAVLRRRSAKQ
jgi:hypothetical protein